MPRTLPRQKKPQWPYVLNRDSDLANGLIGWWPGDPPGGNKLWDLSGKGHNGTLTNFPNPFVPTQGWAQGLDGGRSAISYTQGSSNYVDLGNSSALNPALMTVSCWFRTLNSNTQMLMTRDDNALGRAYFFGINNTGGDLTFQVGGSSVAPAVTFALGTWYHACGTADGTNISVYLNGKKLATTAASSVSATTGASRIGSRTFSGFNNFFSGYIEECRLYNRALTAPEVFALYAPATRWDLRYQTGKRGWFLTGAAVATSHLLSSLGVGG